MNKTLIIKKTADHVKKKFLNDASGHDWWHMYRVWQMAIRIGKKEKADLFIVELGALLHDIADYKFNGGDDHAGGRAAADWLRTLSLDEITIEKVVHIVDNVSFKGAGVTPTMESLEGKVVQDADRLDAIGAVGVARAFAYGGSKNMSLYDPTTKPIAHTTFAQYKKGSKSTVTHFYEKLLLLEKLMNTKTAKAIAKERHRFMADFIKRFLREWDGKA